MEDAPPAARRIDVRVPADIPGRPAVAAISHVDGQRVYQGETIMTLTSDRGEGASIKAPCEGRLELHAAEGQKVTPGRLLAEVQVDAPARGRDLSLVLCTPFVVLFAASIFLRRHELGDFVLDAFLVWLVVAGWQFMRDGGW